MGLEKFDDSTPYGISEASEKRLVKIEVHRLCTAAADPGPLLFSSDGALPATTEPDLLDLSNLADQIILNFEILKNDNARKVLEHCPARIFRAITDFKSSRRRLYARYKQDQARVQGCQPKTLEPPERNRKIYFALVDYITASIARLVVRSAVSAGGYWESHTIAILAQWAMKLKVVSHDPAHYASIALDEGEALISGVVEGMKSKQALALLVPVAPDATEQKSVTTLDTETDITTRYYEENILFRYHMEYLFRQCLHSLYASEKTGRNAASFESCTLVYKTGLDETLTLLSSDREGDISASSDPSDVRYTYAALDLVLKNALEVKRKSLGSQKDIETVIRWEWTDGTNTGHNISDRLSTSNLDELISVLVPFGLASTYTAITMDGLVQLASTGTEEEDPLLQFQPPPKGLRALFTVSTAEFLNQQRRLRSEKYHDPEILPVSKSPFRRGIRGKYMLTYYLVNLC
jgi:hypothetical protein